MSPSLLLRGFLLRDFIFQTLSLFLLVKSEINIYNRHLTLKKAP